MFDRADRHRFLTPLARSAREVSDHEFTTLLDGEWRSRLTAASPIGLDRREQFRGRIGELLLASQDTYASQCPASANCRTREVPGSALGNRGEAASTG